MTSIVCVIGAPRNGVHLLSNCLSMLGCRTVGNSPELDPTLITSLLFQELDIDPFMVGSIPEGWLNSKAAEMAKRRIKSMISCFKQQNGSIVLSAPSLCRTMPIWMDVFNQADIKPDFIHCMRHPWETSQALAKSDNIELDKAHLIWLSHTLDSVKICKQRDHVLITFDQLLHDTVYSMERISDQLGLSYSENLREIYPKLIQFVQPSLSKNKANGLSEKEKSRFAVFRDLYNQILGYQSRSGFYGPAKRSLSGMENSNVVDPFKNGANDQSLQLNEISSEILETVFRAISIFEKRIKFENKYLTSEGNHGWGLFATLGIFENVKSRYHFEKVSLPLDQWFEINVPIESSYTFKDQQLRIIPLNTNGVVKISAVKVENKATGHVLWSAETVRDFDAFNIDGHAVRLPDKNVFALLVTGNRPIITRSLEDQLFDCPIEIKMWIKVCTLHEFLKRKEYVIYDKNNSSASVTVSKSIIIPNDLADEAVKHILPKNLENTTEGTLRYFIRKKDKMLKTKDFAKQCRYKMPAFLVSYPRSGSNYLQNVVSVSSDLFCCSLYAPRPKNPQCVFLFKSHALSLDYLRDEIGRYYPEMEMPKKIIWLKRDPRDVMISFYEFVKYKKGIKIEQRDFLNYTDYDYAFVGDSKYVHSYLRKIKIAPLSVLDAYIAHVESWNEFKSSIMDIHKVKYEDLVDNPATFFKKIFDFLEIDATLNTESLSNKVSLHSDEKRKRGQPYGWKDNNTHIQLIEQVNNTLSKYIQKLGY